MASLGLLRFHMDFSMFLQTRTSGILIELTCFREAAGRGNNIGLALNLCAEQLRVAEVPGAEPVNSGKMVSCPTKTLTSRETRHQGRIHIRTSGGGRWDWGQGWLRRTFSQVPVKD